jgi:hypothetical protein
MNILTNVKSPAWFHAGLLHHRNLCEEKVKLLYNVNRLSAHTLYLQVIYTG